MHDAVWINGTVVPLASARLSPASAGALYGWGVFTTIGVVSGRPRALDAHWERLAAHAERLHVPLAWSREEVAGGLDALLAASGVETGRARVTILRATAGLWGEPGARASDATIFVAARPSAAREPASITVSPYRVNTASPIVGAKSTAYVEHLLALEEARSRSFDEAILLNERGEVVEATAANLFWARDGELFTPALGTGCVAGVTRRFVLAAAARRKIRVTEAGFPLTAVGEADEVFLTNSGWGLVPVAQFDIHAYVAPGPMATLLARDVDVATAAST